MPAPSRRASSDRWK